MVSIDGPGEHTLDLGPPIDTPAPSAEDDAMGETPGPAPRDELSTQQRIEARVRQRLLVSPPAAHRIGRFLVLEPIGRGGMGVVYSAYDEKLDRKIAVKVLHDDDLPDEDDRLRFLREARAMARLSHPHVVTVHEVDEHDDQIFLAMEYVAGQSLDAWLRTEPAWPQVLEAFVKAGQGLQAAHAEGLVHRDFKPHNVMRAEDGVVKVLDFGLARVATDSIEASAEDVSLSRSQPTLSSSLTRTGTVMGTPAYMAPEQFLGDAVDDRCDQYCFCVALWEGLTGARPFGGSSLEALYEARMAGPPPWPSNAPPVPRTLVEALRRGLSPKPRDRWPSMDALLTELHRAPSSARGRGWLGLTGMGALVVGGAVAMTGSETRPPPCQDARGQLAGIWDDARQAEITAAIVGVGVGSPYARDVEARTQRALAAYAEDWVAVHTQACEATTVRGEQSPRVLDLRMRCLHRAAEDLRATVDTLADADDEVVRRAHSLVGGLRPLSRCEDIEALEADVEPPLPGEADAVERARQHLARARSQQKAGRYQSARESITAAEAALEGVEYGPVRSELLNERGNVLDALGEYEAARQALSEAVRAATRWGQRRVAADAAIGLMHVVGYQLSRGDEAMVLQPLVLGLTEDAPRLRMEYREILGGVLVAQGKYTEAEAEDRALLALHLEARGPDHPATIAARSHLGLVLTMQGKLEEAEGEFRRAIRARQQSLGPDHPAVGDLRNNLASALTRSGKLDEAAQEHQAVLALITKALGPEHPDVGRSHLNLGTTLSMQGKLDEAIDHLRTARALWEKRLGPESVDVLMVRNNLANILRKQGELDEAETELRFVLERRLRSLSPDHPEVADTRWNLADVLRDRGRYEEAMAEITAAMAAYEKAVGPRHPWIADSREALAGLHGLLGHEAEAEAEARAALALRLEVMDPDDPAIAMSRTTLAESLREAGRPSEALPLAEKAWARQQRDDVLPEMRGYSAYVLATILHEVEGPARDRTRARALVEESLRSYRTAGLAKDIREAQQWLAEHPAGH